MDNSDDNFKSFNSSNKLGSFSYLLREQSSKVISFKKIKTNRARKRRIKSMETINSKEEFKITVNPIKNINLLKSDVFNVKIPYSKHKTVFPSKKFHSRSVSVSPQTTHRKLATQTISATFRPISKERKAVSKYTKFLDELLSKQTATKTVSTQKRVFDLAEEEKMMSAYSLNDYVREKARCLVRGEPSLRPEPHLNKTNIVDKAVDNLRRKINFTDSGNCLLGEEMVVIMIETEIKSIVTSLETTGNIVKLKGFSSKTAGNEGSVMFPMINQELQIRKEQAIPVQRRKVSTTKQRKSNLFTIKDESEDNQSEQSAKQRNSKANMQALFDLLKGDDFIERNIEAISKNMPFAMKDESSTDRALVEPKRQIISTKQVKVFSVEENIKKMERVIQNSSLKTDEQILESLKENKKSVKNAFLSLINVSEEASYSRSSSKSGSLTESLSETSSLSVSLSETVSVQDEEGNRIDSKMVLVMDKGVFMDREGRIIRKNTLSRSEKGETVSLESNKRVIIINVKGEEVDLEGEVVKRNGEVRNFKVNRKKTFKKVKFEENVDKFEYKKKHKRGKYRNSSKKDNIMHSDRVYEKKRKHSKRVKKERKRTRNARMKINRSLSLNQKDSKKEEKEHRKIYKKYKSIRFYGIKKEVYPNYYTEESKDLDCTYLTGRDEFNANKEIENKEKVRRIIGKYKEIRERRDSKRAKRDAFKQETLQEMQTQNVLRANRKYKEMVEKEDSSSVKLVPVEKMRKRTFKSSKKLLLNLSKDKKTEQTTKGRTTLNSKEKSHKERLSLNSREKQRFSNKNSDLKNIFETKNKPKKKSLVKIIKKKKNKSKQKKKENKEKALKSVKKEEDDVNKENEDPVLSPKSPVKSIKSKISSPLKKISSPLKEEKKEISKELKEEALFTKTKKDNTVNKLYSKVVSSSNSNSVSKHNSSKHLQGLKRQSNMDEMYQKLKGRVTNSNNSRKSLVNLQEKFEVNSPGNSEESESESDLDEVEVLHSDQNDTLSKIALLKKLGIDLTDPKFLKLSKREIEEVVKNKKSDKIWEMVLQ